MKSMSDSFEEAFGNFIHRREYDQAEQALFSMVRISFMAGWLAAGGKAPKTQPVIELMHMTDIPKDGIITDIDLD